MICHLQWVRKSATRLNQYILASLKKENKKVMFYSRLRRICDRKLQKKKLDEGGGAERNLGLVNPYTHVCR
jgi:hypothetical protein